MSNERWEMGDESFCHFCCINVRRFFAQRNSPFDMGDFRVLQSARQSLEAITLGGFHFIPKFIHFSKRHLLEFAPLLLCG